MFSIPYAHFDQIQYFFKVLKTDFTIQYFEYCVGTLFALLNPQLKNITARFSYLQYVCRSQTLQHIYTVFIRLLATQGAKK